VSAPPANIPTMGNERGTLHGGLGIKPCEFDNAIFIDAALGRVSEQGDQCGSVVSPFFTSDSLRESKLLPTEAQPQRKAVAIRMQSVSHTLGSPKPAKISIGNPHGKRLIFPSRKHAPSRDANREGSR